MKVLRGYKVELDLNNKQQTLCRRHAGAARYAYNWGLNRKIEARAAGERTPTAIDLHRELNARKKVDLGWMYEVSKCAPRMGSKGKAMRDAPALLLDPTRHSNELIAAQQV